MEMKIVYILATAFAESIESSVHKLGGKKIKQNRFQENKINFFNCLIPVAR